MFLGEKEKSDVKHHPAAFINAIREEGTKQEACDWLQKTWDELCQLRQQRDDILEFVHRWAWVKEGNGTSDSERLDVIKHYPPISNYKDKANV